MLGHGRGTAFERRRRPRLRSSAKARRRSGALRWLLGRAENRNECLLLSLIVKQSLLQGEKRNCPNLAVFGERTPKLLHHEKERQQDAAHDDAGADQVRRAEVRQRVQAHLACCRSSATLLAVLPAVLCALPVLCLCSACAALRLLRAAAAVKPFTASTSPHEPRANHPLDELAVCLRGLFVLLGRSPS